VYAASGLAYYRHADWLGSSRLASTPSRTKYYDVGYAPYGESYGGSGTTDLNFTGQNQDTVSGLYDFMYREYHPVQGRWISPDPAGLAAVNPTNPQTWNRYAYVANSPFNAIDLFGLNGQHVSSIPDDFFGGSCTVNGMATPCSTAGGMIAAGGGAQCLNNVCEGVDTNGNFAQYACFAGGTCGYFDNSDIAQGVWEWNGVLLTEAGWNEVTQPYSDKMQGLLAAILGVNVAGLTPLGLKGGNANFKISEAVGNAFISSDSTCQSGLFGTRCDDFTLHFSQQSGNDGAPYWTVHMDSADAYSVPFGLVMHGIIDVIGGNTIFQGGVPH